MLKIVSIGTPAKNLAAKFSRFQNYGFFAIDDTPIENFKNTFTLPRLEQPEDYETIRLPGLEKFLKKISGEVLVVVCGASTCSGVTLRLLEKIYKNRTKNIKILYISPETDLLSKTKKLQERVVRNVLQQYTRSGIFKNMVMVSNESVEKSIENCTILEYYDKINETIAYSYHMIEVFKNSNPISSTVSSVDDCSRISTIGVSSVDGANLDLFYPLQDPREIVYYYGMSEDKIKNEKNLLRTIMESAKNKTSEHTRASFSIYQTGYDDDYVYVEYHSPIIQKNI